jgi:hypothetical protein
MMLDIMGRAREANAVLDGAAARGECAFIGPLRASDIRAYRWHRYGTSREHAAMEVKLVVHYRDGSMAEGYMLLPEET